MSRGPSQQAETSKSLIHSPMWVKAYRRYFRLWLNLAKTIGVSEEEAKDILHGVISAILSEPSKQFESMEHIRNYVARAVLNRAIQAKRREERREALTGHAEAESAILPEELDSEETRKFEALREGIERLGKNEYEVVRLRFYFGMTFREISEKSNIPISTLKSREEAALKKIREYLRKKGF